MRHHHAGAGAGEFIHVPHHYRWLSVFAPFARAVSVVF
jgi:hypothetical protein